MRLGKIEITSLYCWTEKEIIFMDQDDYQYQILEVDNFADEFTDEVLDEQEKYYVRHNGWYAYDEEFDLLHDINKFIRLFPESWSNYVKIIN